eukprot:1371673-Alexandrium_andersonii.AAC.1
MPRLMIMLHTRLDIRKLSRLTRELVQGVAWPSQSMSFRSDGRSRFMSLLSSTAGAPRATAFCAESSAG